MVKAPPNPTVGAAESADEGARRVFRTRRGRACELPAFLPVYQPHKAPVPIRDWERECGVQGCIVNAYFLYKDRETRRLFAEGAEIHDYIGFGGIVMTDSGAYQGFNRPLLLANKKIVAFQNQIGADVVSPLDLVTPPGDNRTVAEKKLDSTLKRIREAKRYCTDGILAGVQQGGRFRELRRRSVAELMEIGVEYLAIGSLVPFFNANHNLEFVAEVIRDAREIAGPRLPMHVFGAGDPVELPFLAALGADIFDSSSYGHYAAGGWYMTPYGSFKDPAALAASEIACACPVCAAAGSASAVMADEMKLRAHNLRTILDTVERLRQAVRADALDSLLAPVLERHEALFPESRLAPSWRAAQD